MSWKCRRGQVLSMGMTEGGLNWTGSSPRGSLLAAQPPLRESHWPWTRSEPHACEYDVCGRFPPAPRGAAASKWDQLDTY
jgi:hypothetical protein